jgi:hypothetical protein
MYAQIAATTFEEKYGAISDMTIIAKWQQLALAYRLRSRDTRELANDLYQALVKRDSFYMQGEEIIEQYVQGSDARLFEACEQKITTIKQLTIATLIMEMTRQLPDEHKAILNQVCLKILEKHEDSDKLSTNMIERSRKFDPLRVENVTSLKFTHKDLDILLRLYEMKQDVFDQDGQLKPDL